MSELSARTRSGLERWPEHDPEVHASAGVMFYFACTRCVWLAEARRELAPPLPDCRATEELVAAALAP